MGNVYEGLVRIDQDSTIQPLLATSWELDDAGTTYTFHLREGVKFSNGDEFTADTAKFSIDRVADWSNGLKASMSVVDHTEVVDQHTLKVVLKQRSNGWLWSMGTLVGAMMTPNGVANLATKPVGTGPYVVDKWAVGTWWPDRTIGVGKSPTTGRSSAISGTRFPSPTRYGPAPLMQLSACNHRNYWSRYRRTIISSLRWAAPTVRCCSA